MAWSEAPAGRVLWAAGGAAWSERRGLGPCLLGGDRGRVLELLSSHPLAFQFRISEYAPLTMVGAEQPPSPELRPEGVAEYGDGEAPAGGGDVGPQQPGRTHPHTQASSWAPTQVGRGLSILRSLGGGVATGGVAWIPAGAPGVGPEVEKAVGGLSCGN